VERLVQAGLVEREQHPRERRRVQMRLTDAGASALAACDSRTRAWLCERLSGLDQDDLERLAGTLAELRRLLAAEGADATRR
jgi:DNA-binding MarR family transcriptional regulator